MNKTVEELFEVHGYYEELVESVGGRFKLVGTRKIEKPVGRELGSGGVREYEFRSPIELDKGLKKVILRASEQKPRRCCGYAQAICGRLKTI